MEDNPSHARFYLWEKATDARPKEPEEAGRREVKQCNAMAMVIDGV